MADNEIEVRRLRSALEFATLIAQEGQKVRPQIASPAALGKYTNAGRLPRAALAAVRRIVETNPEFRERVAAGATPDLVDAVGLLWLQRPDGWEDAIRDAVAEAEAAEESASLAAELKQAERRRAAAERAAARAIAELSSRDERIAELEAERAFLSDEVVARDELVATARAELASMKVEARHSRDREQAARDRARALAADLERALAAGRTVDDATDADGPIAQAALDTADGVDGVSVIDAEELAAVTTAATELAARLVSLSGDTDGGDVGIDDRRPTDPASRRPSAPRPKRRRRPLPMPGGVMGDSDRATRFLLESGGTVIIDGYNVAKLAWPSLALDHQRDRLIDATEVLVRRWGTEVTVVFDGSGIPGAYTTRRSAVRVVYSDADQTADDWIRDEVRRLPVSRAVTVVTDDREIRRDVRTMGANLLSSRQLIAAFA